MWAQCSDFIIWLWYCSWVWNWAQRGRFTSVQCWSDSVPVKPSRNVTTDLTGGRVRPKLDAFENPTHCLSSEVILSFTKCRNYSFHLCKVRWVKFLPPLHLCNHAKSKWHQVAVTEQNLAHLSINSPDPAYLKIALRCLTCTYSFHLKYENWPGLSP